MDDSRSGAARFLPREPVGESEAKAAAARFRQVCRHRRKQGRAAPRRSQVDRRVERAWRRLDAGDLTAARRLLRDMDPVTVRRALPPRHRDEVVGELLLVHADEAMQRGAPGPAVRAAEGVLCLDGTLNRESRALRVLGAAHRMVLTPTGQRSALEAYERALERTRDLPDDIRGQARSAIHLGAVAPALVAGGRREAERHLGAGLDSAPGEEAEVLFCESLCRRAQIALHSADGDGARSVLASLPGELPRYYLEGWRARLRANAELADPTDDETWNRQMAEAWHFCAGYGFQELLVLARLVEGADRFDTDAWPQRPLRSIRRRIATRHRQRWHSRPSECATCAGYSAPVQAAHALDTTPGTLVTALGT